MKKTIFFIACSILIIYLINFLFITSISDNPLGIRNSSFKKNIMNGLFPEGWAFFTRSPREERLSLYKIKSKNEIEEVSLNNSTFDVYWGACRNNRVIHGKISKIANNINPNLWTTFSAPDTAINKINIESLSILKIKALPPVLYGTFVLKSSKAVPYMWFSGSKVPISTKSKFVILKIEK